MIYIYSALVSILDGTASEAADTVMVAMDAQKSAAAVTKQHSTLVKKAMDMSDEVCHVWYKYPKLPSEQQCGFLWNKKNVGMLWGVCLDIIMQCITWGVRVCMNMNELPTAVYCTSVTINSFFFQLWQKEILNISFHAICIWRWMCSIQGIILARSNFMHSLDLCDTLRFVWIDCRALSLLDPTKLLLLLLTAGNTSNAVILCRLQLSGKEGEWEEVTKALEARQDAVAAAQKIADDAR